MKANDIKQIVSAIESLLDGKFREMAKQALEHEHKAGQSDLSARQHERKAAGEMFVAKQAKECAEANLENVRMITRFNDKWQVLRKYGCDTPEKLSDYIDLLLKDIERKNNQISALESEKRTTCNPANSSAESTLSGFVRPKFD